MTEAQQPGPPEHHPPVPERGHHPVPPPGPPAAPPGWGGWDHGPYQQGPYGNGPYQQGPYGNGPYQQGPYGPGPYGPPPAGWGPNGRGAAPPGNGWARSSGGPSGGWPHERPGQVASPRRWIAVIVALAVVAILARTGHIESYSIALFIALVPSVVLHEVSHGWVAYAFGDDTAKRAGRLSLNPLAHVDLFGTIIVPAVFALSSLGIIGWAKPVPTNVQRLRHGRDINVVVSLAGPATNVLLALAAALLYRDVVPVQVKVHLLETGSFSAQPMWCQLLFALGFVNVLLAVFNLIPLPPLDGSAVVERFLPASWLPGYYRVRPYTLLLPMLLLVLSSLANPNDDILYRLFNPAFTWWEHIVGL